MQNPASVLVVGGGIVGLAAALFLRMSDVPVVLVERRAAPSPLPRARGWTPRTMELFRAAGIARLVEGQASSGHGPPGRIRVESLAGEWFEELAWTSPRTAQSGTDQPAGRDEPRYSPERSAGLNQDCLEPIIVGRAVELGADMRFRTELVELEQDSSGVTATARGESGSQYTLRVAYVIAADGDASSIREALKIGRRGRGKLQTMRSVLFRARIHDGLAAKVAANRERGIVQYIIDQPDFTGFFGGGIGDDDRWLLMFPDDRDRDEEALRDVAKKAIGITDLNPQIIATGLFDASALIADHFRQGRVFLAGDAAHTLPPSRGGYGANTGIEDVHNLAWKLAAVLATESLPDLLDTYDAERRPIAWLRHDQIFARPDYAAYADKSASTPIIDDAAMEFGQLYRSAAVYGAVDDLPQAMRPDQWAGHPGTRAPHLWLTRHGGQISTLDLFQHGWVLLTEAQNWRAASKQAAETLGIALDYLQIGTDISAAEPAEAQTFRAAFGLGEFGATLIRPDGYVAWRSVDLPIDPTNALLDALGRTAAAWRTHDETDDPANSVAVDATETKPALTAQTVWETRK